MKKLLLLILILAVIIGGYFGYQHYQSQELVRHTAPTVKEASLRTKAVTDFITDPSNATYGEVFSKADETVKKISELLITVESQNSDANPEAIAAAVEYLKAAQTLTRGINTAIRLRLDSSNAQDAADEAVKGLKSTNEYTRKFAREQIEKTIERMQSTLDKMVTHRNEISVAIAHFKTTHALAGKFFPADALLPTKAIQDLEEHFAEDEKQKS